MTLNDMKNYYFDIITDTLGLLAVLVITLAPLAL